MKIDTLPQEDQTNGWSLILPSRTPRPPLKRSLQADWLVIGAGFAGLAAARRLAQLYPEAQIALVDAGTVGENASGRNSGFAIDVPHNVGSSQEELAKAQNYQHLLHAGVQQLESLIAQHSIDCDWKRAGKYHCAVSPEAEKTLRHHVEELERLGEQVDWFERDALHQRLGTRHFRSGIYTPGCVLLNPAALCRGLADSLPENVLLYENTPIVEIDINDRNVSARTPAGVISARQLILANNGFAQQLGFYRAETFPAVTFASLSKPLNAEQRRRYGVEQGWGVTPANAIVGATMRYTEDHRILIRQGFVLPRNFRISPAQRAHACKTHRQVFDVRFPQIADVELEHFWAGTISITRNGAPRWGQVAPNVHVLAGCNGVGIIKQTILGTLLVDAAAGEDNALIADALALGQPSKLPPSPFMDLGARAYLAKEFWTGRHEF